MTEAIPNPLKFAAEAHAVRLGVFAARGMATVKELENTHDVFDQVKALGRKAPLAVLDILNHRLESFSRKLAAHDEQARGLAATTADIAARAAGQIPHADMQRIIKNISTSGYGKEGPALLTRTPKPDAN